MMSKEKQTATEMYPNGISLSFHDCDKLETRKSRYQLIEVYDHKNFGKLLFIDGMVMFSEKDYKNNREMMINISLHCRDEFEAILIIGGGDGSSPGEATKYSYLKDIHVVDIDEEVTKICRKHFDFVIGSFTDSRIKYIFKEGLRYVEELNNAAESGKYGVIIVSPTDPDKLSSPLYSVDFFLNAFKLLDKNGVLCIGGFSPYYELGTLTARNAYDNMKKAFPNIRVFYASVPTYPGGLVAYLVASKTYEPSTIHHKPLTTAQYNSMIYYNLEVHSAAFKLPNNLVALFGLEKE